MLDVRRLRLLYELSQRGTLAATARALDYTPSAVSQQLAALEREAGAVLLERDGRGVRLTDAAHALVRRTRRVIDELACAEAELQANAGRVAGVVRVAAFPTAARALVAPAARALRHAHPDVVLNLREADPEDGLELLRAGATDVLLAYEYDLLTPLRDGGMERVHLMDDPVLAALPLDHPLGGRRAVELRRLRDERWIAGLPGTAFGALVHRVCRQAGFEPRVSHRAREFAVQEALVAAGLGVALLPALGRRNTDEVRFVRLRAPTAVRRITALSRRGTSERPAVKATIDELIRAAEGRL